MYFINVFKIFSNKRTLTLRVSDTDKNSNEKYILCLKYALIYVHTHINR